MSQLETDGSPRAGSPRIVYVLDTLCGWCNVARPEVSKLHSILNNRVPFVALHARLFTGANTIVIDSEFLASIRNVGWTIGPRMTGQQFTESYMDMIGREGHVVDSSLTSHGSAAAARLGGETTAFRYAERLQSLVFDEGRDPDDIDTIVTATMQLDCDLSSFRAVLDEPATAARALDDAQLARQLQRAVGASGTPTLLFQSVDGSARLLDPYSSVRSLAVLDDALG